MASSAASGIQSSSYLRTDGGPTAPPWAGAERRNARRRHAAAARSTEKSGSRDRASWPWEPEDEEGMAAEAAGSGGAFAARGSIS